MLQGQLKKRKKGRESVEQKAGKAAAMPLSFHITLQPHLSPYSLVSCFDWCAFSVA